MPKFAIITFHKDAHSKQSSIRNVKKRQFSTTGMSPRCQELLADLLYSMKFRIDAQVTPILSSLYFFHSVSVPFVSLFSSHPGGRWKYAHNKGTTPVGLARLPRCVMHVVFLHPALTLVRR